MMFDVPIKIAAAVMAVMAGENVTARKPNVVLYLADDLGVGSINQHAPEWSFFEDQPEALEQIPLERRIYTPTLEKMAMEGKRLMRSYVGSPVCGPSRHSLLTGAQPGYLRVRGNGFGENGKTDADLNEETPTLGELFSSNGYTTAAFGKWGVASGEESSGVPCKRGFESFYGKLGHSDMGHAFPRYMMRCDGTGSNVVSEKIAANKNPSVKKCLDTDKCSYFDFMIRDKALEFIQSQQGNKAPFFVYWATSAGHSALFEQVNKFNNCEEKTHPVPTYGRYTEEALEGTGRLSDEIRGLMAMVTYTVDEDMRLLLETLEANGMEDDTLIVMTSDNGPHREAFRDKDYHPDDTVAGGGLNGIKRRLREGGIRVPTLLWWPRRIPGGTASYYPFASYDLALTLADAAGMTKRKSIRKKFDTGNRGGTSLWKIWKAKNDKKAKAKTRKFINVEMCFLANSLTSNSNGKNCPVKWVDEVGCGFAYFDLSEWPKRVLKIIQNQPGLDIEIFDILNDPMEQNNIWTEELEEELLAKRSQNREPICEIEPDDPAC